MSDHQTLQAEQSRPVLPRALTIENQQSPAARHTAAHMKWPTSGVTEEAVCFSCVFADDHWMAFA